MIDDIFARTHFRLSLIVNLSIIDRICTGPWSECLHYNCGEGGLQKREVWCSHDSGWSTLDSNCDPLHQPPAQQPCFHICAYHRYLFSWRPTPWSDCQPKTGLLACEEPYGVQHRDVTCVTNCGTKAAEDYVCEHFEPRPATSQICKLQCPDECITTEFGSWSKCDKCWMKNHTRSRTILHLPSGGAPQCIDLLQTKPCGTLHGCQYNKSNRFSYKIGPWTVCDPLQSDQQWRRVRQYLNVLGQRSRTVQCIDEDGRRAEPSSCEHIEKPPDEELCVLSRDCIVSSWSEWTVERVTWVRNQSRDSAVRTRHIVQLPSASGYQCPELREKRLVNFDEMRERCFRYRWELGNWSRCQGQIEGETCGAGLQLRNSVCVRATDGVPVESRFCELPVPTEAQTCSIPCPMDCVLGEWSDWSECLPHRCKLSNGRTKQGYRVRERRVYREGLYGGRSCGHTKEIQPCHYPPCYYWRAVPSGVCQLKYPEFQCGDGTMTRDAECVSRRGTLVSARLCYLPRPEDTEECTVPCEHDCVTSEWSVWTECSRSCGVRRQSGFRTRTKLVLAYPTAGGGACPPVRTLMDKMRCNEYPCTVYYWHPGEWGSCDLQRRRCGLGTQERDVECYSRDDEKVSSKRCPIEEKPSARRNCTIACPRLCKVTDYTDWSSCPVSCYTDTNLDRAYQERHRFVLDFPEGGAPECPDLREVRPCPALPPCLEYQWQVGLWSKCIFPQHYHKCGDGYRARVIKCMQDGTLAPEEFCLAQSGPPPDATRRCHVNCEVEVCKFSDWSDFSVCPRRCGVQRTRNRTMEGYTDKIAECYDKSRYPLEEHLTCACSPFRTSPIEQWSHCVLDTEFDPLVDRVKTSEERHVISSSTTEGYCGIGRRVQAIVCRDSDGYNSSAATCGHEPFMQEMCFIPCPRDCLLSEWSAWSRCVVEKCGNGLQNRSRYMIEAELDGGRQCPPLVAGEEYQSRPCHVSCDQFTWLSDDWSDCSPLVAMAQDENCGAGLQSRTVRCMKKVGDSEEDYIEVEESHCDNRIRPKDTNYCHVPCPGHCVLSNWTPWSVCPQNCDSRDKRVRSRTIIRQPSVTTGAKCPPLEETESCEEGRNCFRYAWTWSPWSTCILDVGAVCGRGRRTRFKECRRNQVDKVPNEICAQKLGDANVGPGEEDCLIPCPVDCVVTHWTDWTPCSKSCGLGMRTRSRDVIVESAHRGRLCPEPLIQHHPCPYQDCYGWVAGNWSECKIQGNACGYGEKTRAAICVRHDGIQVAPGHCADVPMPYMEPESPCQSPCPGDCHMSEWSHWGPCHRPCTPEGDQAGTQTRSRVVLFYPSAEGESCPGDRWQSRNCSSGPCATYSWHASPWRGDYRDVWCVSADNVRVKGGCRDAARPINRKSCDPPCHQDNALCEEIDECGCFLGFEPIFDQGQLLACVRRVDGKNSTKNGDLDAENLALYYPNGPSNFWMYAVIAAAAAFVIFILVALYSVCKGFRAERGRRRLGDLANSSEANTTLLPHTRLHDLPNKDAEDTADTPGSETKRLTALL